MQRGTGRRRYLKTDDLETKAKQIDDIFLQEEQNQKQVDRELSLLKEDMFRESQVREYTLHRVRAEYALGLSIRVRAEYHPRRPCAARSPLGWGSVCPY